MADVDVNKNLSEQIKVFTVDAIIKSVRKRSRPLGTNAIVEYTNNKCDK